MGFWAVLGEKTHDVRRNSEVVMLCAGKSTGFVNRGKALFVEVSGTLEMSGSGEVTTDMEIVVNDDTVVTNVGLKVAGFKVLFHCD